MIEWERAIFGVDFEFVVDRIQRRRGIRLKKVVFERPRDEDAVDSEENVGYGRVFG